jgi:hypothetical protein
MNPFSVFYMYIMYIYTYIIMLLHYHKPKLILNHGVYIYHQDYVLYYILIGIVLIYFYQKLSYIKNKYYHYSIYIILPSICIFYALQPYIYLHKYIYFLESIFFNFLGLFGLILPLLFIHQLFFLLFLILILMMNYLFSSLHISYNILGSWNDCLIFHWMIFILILIIYIFFNLLVDILKDNTLTSKNISNNSIIGNKKNKILFHNQNIHPYNFWTEKEIDIVYRSISPNIIAENILTDELLRIFKIFQIEGDILNVLQCKTVTNYFFKPKIGTKMSRIESIEEEISIELSRRVRITSNLKGIIIEVENLNVQNFSFKDIWTNDINNMILPLFLGFNTFDEKVIIDLTKQPHILMCGTTGSGKSSTLHVLIHSIITTKLPNEVKFLLIDPKILELSVYNHIPYLWQDIITNLEDAVIALENLIIEMETRYKQISQNNKRSILEYNHNTKKYIPHIVCIIEEFADLICIKNNEFQILVQRLAQMGRAAGIHLIICTQRPSVNVINGTVKANFPTRMALRVTNKLESRIILDTNGAERLSHPGEMLVLDASGIIQRIISPYINEDEIKNLIEKIKLSLK